MRAVMERLRSRIVEAFPLAPIPEAPLLRTYDDENIIPTFLGRPWDSFTTRELRDHSAAISFLTSSAFAYYLPAFLTATLDDPEIADIIPDNLLFKFAASSEAADVARRLTSAQRRVVADFFVAYVGEDPCFLKDLASACETLSEPSPPK
jgi:hypothetical protein